MSLMLQRVGADGLLSPHSTDSFQRLGKCEHFLIMKPKVYGWNCKYWPESCDCRCGCVCVALHQVRENQGVEGIPEFVLRRQKGVQLAGRA